MKTSIVAITLPLLAAGANLQPRQTTQSTSACPSLWSAVLTSAPPFPTAVQEFRSSLSARVTDVCMSFGDPDMPDSVVTALASYQDTFAEYLSRGQASSVYSLCSEWLDQPIQLTDASQIVSSRSRMSVYESCRKDGKLSSWWTSSPVTMTQTGPATTAAATGGSAATSAGQTAATSPPAGGAAARGTPPIAAVPVVVAVVFGSIVAWV
ncbi:hypothetical protein PpBr36_03784 [Pyricularia pennisetigena]|uniref:hypothetical protein n=1 Tax=Pyricularia pennisetigena TaxID=1578925 RepID=UPI0011547917|nr:hypothetical protein PpBr36_03784 [Pyricularia pennisetigena]TLS31235.1 hypothetical protein PpBr36_03784 [Pyricularia pennisetigena]